LTTAVVAKIVHNKANRVSSSPLFLEWQHLDFWALLSIIWLSKIENVIYCYSLILL